MTNLDPGSENRWEDRSFTDFTLTDYVQGLQRSAFDAKHSRVSDVTREEIDAKLAAAEARTETRFVELSGEIRSLTEAIKGDGGVMSQIRDLKADNKYTRWTIVIAFITSAITVIGTIATIQAGLLTAFQTGLANQPPAVQATPLPK